MIHRWIRFSDISERSWNRSNANKCRPSDSCTVVINVSVSCRWIILTDNHQCWIFYLLFVEFVYIYYTWFLIFLVVILKHCSKSCRLAYRSVRWAFEFSYSFMIPRMNHTKTMEWTEIYDEQKRCLLKLKSIGWDVISIS